MDLSTRLLRDRVARLERLLKDLADQVAGLGVGGVSDHGALTGLADDDHPQYHNDARGDVRYAPIANGVTNGDSHDHSGGDGAQIDHGSLAGLADDDHPQYALDTALAAATEWAPTPSRAVFWDDFWANDYSGDHDYYRGVSGGTIAPTYTANGTGVLGVEEFTTGGGITGYSYIRVFNNWDYWAGGGEVTFVCYVNFAQVVDGSNTWSARIGIGDSASFADHTDGIYFDLAVALGSYTLDAVCSGAGTQTRTATGITIVANTWYQLRWVMNAAGNSVDFSVWSGGVQIGSTTTIATANIPAPGERCAPELQIAKSGVGGGDMKMHIDYWGLKKDFTNPRY